MLHGLGQFAGHPEVTPLLKRPDAEHAYHLYVVRVAGDRNRAFATLREQGIGVNVHYLPVYMHPYYRNKFGTRPGACPEAERQFERILSLPIFPTLEDADIDRVVAAVISAAS